MRHEKKILVTTVPFGETDITPIELLKKAGVEIIFNPIGRKLSEIELVNLIPGVDVLIAGTEQISQRVMDAGKNLKLISRVGIGLDSVDLNAAKKRGILVAYTPDAPSSSVAELAICQILSLLRLTHPANNDMHQGKWNRYFGRRIGGLTVGVVGLGRIGIKLVRLLSAFEPKTILVNDILGPEYVKNRGVKWAEKEEIYAESDIITLHVPLTAKTKNLIGNQQLMKMKRDAILINTSRGGIVNERDLYQALTSGHLHGAAMDVFNLEPYGDAPLSFVANCLLTSHMGSMSFDSRELMELDAVKEVLRFLCGDALRNPVPDFEYEIQKELYE